MMSTDLPYRIRASVRESQFPYFTLFCVCGLNSDKSKWGIKAPRHGGPGPLILWLYRQLGFPGLFGTILLVLWAVHYGSLVW